jgi:hypothetical protein
MLLFYHISPLGILPLQPSPQAFSYSLYDDGKQVAIKLLTHLMDNTDGLHAFTTFIQEARMIHPKHPHIIPGL